MHVVTELDKYFCWRKCHQHCEIMLIKVNFMCIRLSLFSQHILWHCYTNKVCYIHTTKCHKTKIWTINFNLVLVCKESKTIFKNC